jgi:hypothetical protein
VLHCPDCQHKSPALSSQQEVLQQIAAHLAAAAARGRPCPTLQAGYSNGRCNSGAAFGYSAGEPPEKPTEVEEPIIQLLARITLAAALHILIATRPEAGKWEERQSQAEIAATGTKHYTAAAAAAAAPGQVLGLAELLPWRLWAERSVLTTPDSDDACLVLCASYARPSLASLRAEGWPCLLDLMFTGPYVEPSERHCGFLLERLAVLLLRFKQQQQRQQDDAPVACGGHVEPAAAAAAAAGSAGRPRHSQRAASAAASAALASHDKLGLVGSSSTLTAAEVQQLLSELLSRDVVFQHVPPQQRVQEFLQQLWPGSSMKDVAAAAGKPYVGMHLYVCCCCGKPATRIKSSSFH